MEAKLGFNLILSMYPPLCQNTQAHLYLHGSDNVLWYMLIINNICCAVKMHFQLCRIMRHFGATNQRFIYFFCSKLKYLERNPGARQLFLRWCSCFGNTPYPQLLWPGCLAIATSPELKLLKSLSLHSMWEDMDTVKSILAHVWV